MGCAYSTDGRALFRKMQQTVQPQPAARRLFKVVNVDEVGNEISVGQIEITATELILHQKARKPVVWSLRSIRRYGFDAELFSFECGRRCTTGSGVYGFKCTEAEALFNLMQESVQNCCPSADDYDQASNGESPARSPSQMAAGRPSMAEFGRLPGEPLLPADARPLSSRRAMERQAEEEDAKVVPLPASPSDDRDARTPGSHAYANDLRQLLSSPDYVNTGGFPGPRDSIETIGASRPESAGLAKGDPAQSRCTINQNYAKFEEVQHYMNVKLGQVLPPGGAASEPAVGQPSVAVPAGEENERTVNYTQLDMDTLVGGGDGCATVVLTAPVTPISKNFKMDFADSPPRTPAHHQPGQPYVTIDFDKTVALSNSAASHRKEIAH